MLGNKLFFLAAASSWPPFTEICHFTEESMQESMAEAMFLRMNLEDPDLEAERPGAQRIHGDEMDLANSTYYLDISGYIMIIYII